MSLFIAYPALALLVAAGFLALYFRSRRRLVLGTAIAWLLYAGYEFGMQQRWLCTGECNIRVDLLLLYPVLALLSVGAVIAGFRAPRAPSDLKPCLKNRWSSSSPASAPCLPRSISGWLRPRWHLSASKT